MAYTYDIKTSKKDMKSSSCLFAANLMNIISDLMVSTFLVAFIYHSSPDIFVCVRNIALFELMTYAVAIPIFFVFGYLVEKTNRIWIYRLGVILRTCVVVILIFIGRNVSSMVILAGALRGVSTGTYYSSYNTLKQEMVSRKSIKKYALLEQILARSLEIGAPILLGLFIDMSSFVQAAIVVSVICSIQIILSFFVYSKKPEGSRFDLKRYYKKLKENPAGKKIKLIYLAYCFYGFTSIVGNLLSFCIMIEFGSNFSLGILTSIFSGISMVSILLITRFTKEGKRSWLYIICAILPFLACLLYVFIPSVITVIIYNFFSYISRIIFRTMYDAYRNGSLKEAGLYSEITEHQVTTEVILDLSRVASVLLLILVSLSKSLIAFKAYFCFTMLSYTAILIILVIYEKKYCSTPKEDKVEEKKENIVATVHEVNKVDN